MSRSGTEISPINLEEIDNIIHEPARLGILVLLLSHELGLPFNEIQNALSLSSGNLSSHIKKLANVGYIVVNKQFIDLKPRTWLSITQKGAESLKYYATKLELLLESITV